MLPTTLVADRLLAPTTVRHRDGYIVVVRSVRQHASVQRPNVDRHPVGSNTGSRGRLSPLTLLRRVRSDTFGPDHARRGDEKRGQSTPTG